MQVGDRVWRYYDHVGGDPGVYAGVVERIEPDGNFVMKRPNRAEGFRSRPELLHKLPDNIPFLWAEESGEMRLLGFIRKHFPEAAAGYDAEQAERARKESER